MSLPPAELDKVVRAKFQVKDRFEMPDEEVEFKVVYDSASKARFQELRMELDGQGFVPWLVGNAQDASLVVRRKQPAKGSTSRVPVLLLLLSLASIIAAGLLDQYLYSKLAPEISGYIVLVSFSASVVAIVAAYEFGHRYAAERAGMAPPTPYFIPGVPTITSILPTLGVVTVPKSPAPNRDSLFDISLAGPLAALAVTVVLYAVSEFVWVQYSLSLQASQLANSNITVVQINPGILQLIIDAFSSPFTRAVPQGFAKLSPIADAAFIGFLIVFLNLLPIIKLDGGNLLSTAFGDRLSRPATYLSVAVLLAIDTPTYFAIGIFVLLIAGRPNNLLVLDEVSQISRSKRLIFLAALGLAFLCLPLPQNLATLPLG